MKYRDILGFSKPKRKVIKEQSKPKKNEIIENVKKELLNEWNDTSFRNAPKRWSGASDNGLTEFEQQGGKDTIKEVGAGDEYMPHITKITNLYSDYWHAIQDFEKLLVKKGLKKQGNQFHRMYINMVAKYHKWFVKNIRKLF